LEVQQSIYFQEFSRILFTLWKLGCFTAKRLRLTAQGAAAATLGLKLNGRVNRQAVVAGCRNPDATLSGLEMSRCQPRVEATLGCRPQTALR